MIIFIKESLLDLFICQIYPVKSIQKKSGANKTSDCFVDCEHVCKEQQEYSDSYVKDYHKYPEHCMKLPRNPVAVHNCKICANKRKINLKSNDSQKPLNIIISKYSMTTSQIPHFVPINRVSIRNDRIFWVVWVRIRSDLLMQIAPDPHPKPPYELSFRALWAPKLQRRCQRGISFTIIHDGWQKTDMLL
jgi:hypothetical protein